MVREVDLKARDAGKRARRRTDDARRRAPDDDDDLSEMFPKAMQ